MDVAAATSSRHVISAATKGNESGGTFNSAGSVHSEPLPNVSREPRK